MIERESVPFLSFEGIIISGEAAEELQKMLREDEIRDAVLLVMANKQGASSLPHLDELILARPSQCYVRFGNHR